ncbi:hypothetical protein [Streptomyces sp. NPDC096013]|uniref:MmyB family transcriptional regulator n=1 Tax=Streptomyces sp. NPDC096013 TaxID=3366069 RepID=UPI00381B8F15
MREATERQALANLIVRQHLHRAPGLGTSAVLPTVLSSESQRPTRSTAALSWPRPAARGAATAGTEASATPGKACTADHCLSFYGIADLGTAVADYSHSCGLTDLVEELRSPSAEFARLWDEGSVGLHVSAHKTVVRPRWAR